LHRRFAMPASLEHRLRRLEEVAGDGVRCVYMSWKLDGKRITSASIGGKIIEREPDESDVVFKERAKQTALRDVTSGAVVVWLNTAADAGL
jgi:hypothetical protein